jgi:hypothetical protein
MAKGETTKERGMDEAAITEALRVIAAADERVIAALIGGVDTIEAERLIEKMQALVEACARQWQRAKTAHNPRAWHAANRQRQSLTLGRQVKPASRSSDCALSNLRGCCE